MLVPIIGSLRYEFSLEKVTALFWYISKKICMVLSSQLPSTFSVFSWYITIAYLFQEPRAKVKATVWTDQTTTGW